MKQNIPSAEPIHIVAPELEHLDFQRTNGGLAPWPGLQTFIVLRASKDNPTDERGWTYHHHPDLACWKGRLYVGWNSCEKDEDTWPSRELYSTSEDGAHWSPPAELFPEGASTPLRMYFYHAPNGIMLAIAGLRVSREQTKERTKGPLVVRRISAGHTLGPVYTLRVPDSPLPNQPPYFKTATDPRFTAACNSLLATPMYLEQQDYGVLLPAQARMPWHDPSRWVCDDSLRNEAAEFGKAMCFFRRADGALVGVGKKRWVTVSHDDGHTWTQPVQPPTLITNMGKVWGQRMPNGRYLLAYNPHEKNRFPLAVVTGDDGIIFSDIHVAHGELPTTRYPGRAKSPGASYMRGLSLWSNDGTRSENAVWLVYSVNKEEIWISRLPV